MPSDRIDRVARERFGFEDLRSGQKETIRSVVDGHDTLAVMPTGSGKSAIYQVSALMIPGPAVVISPLIALQRDQVESIEEQEAGGAAQVNFLRVAERKRAGKNPQPTAAVMDSQSVKTVEESAHPSGYDAHKNVKGRKRHLLVDTLGLLLSVYVTPAEVQDRIGARCLLAGLKPFVPRLKKIWADGAYTGEKLAGWCKEQGGWELQIVQRSADTEGFAVLPHRWIVERTLGWLMRNHRLSKDYERMVQSSESFIEVAMIRLILRRLAKGV